MKIKSAEFIKSATDPGGYPVTDLPEIAFVGRSNVGKSSLINNLVQRKKLAKTSSTPGKTQTINFYRVNDCMLLVDLPGYGFTKAPEKTNLQWRQFIDTYLRTRENLRGVIQLIDCRHEPTAMDRRVFVWLMETDLIGGICAVKSDKLSRSRLIQSLHTIRGDLMMPDTISLISHSAVSGKGRLELWKHLTSLAGFSGRDSGTKEQSSEETTDC
ncbi:YihA family ribosome biogenesis GTP-binding protein [bacterium]|nr:YihA family ribosome biogenesis GTP-binding protein [candidate division CSSED10-310 bacterium]